MQSFSICESDLRFSHCTADLTEKFTESCRNFQSTPKKRAVSILIKTKRPFRVCHLIFWGLWSASWKGFSKCDWTSRASSSNLSTRWKRSDEDFIKQFDERLNSNILRYRIRNFIVTGGEQESRPVGWTCNIRSSSSPSQFFFFSMRCRKKQNGIKYDP